MNIRKPRRDDQGYIASTWIRSVSGRDGAGPRGGDIGAQVDAVLDRADTKALVADESSSITGWVVFAEGPAPIVHYVYVRKAARRRGIGAELLRRAGVQPGRAAVFTCRGPDAQLVTDHMCKAAAYLSLQEFLQ